VIYNYFSKIILHSVNLQRDKLKINYFSDLHLEFGDLEFPETDADIIIAAGDIGLRQQGFNWLKQLGKPVIYLAGNHEFYTQDYQTALDTLRFNCMGTKIQFLENNRYIYQGVRFLGCTLWTNLFRDGGEVASYFSKGMNDFRKIQFGDEMWDADKLNKVFEHSLQWLISQLNEPFAGKTVVITHHAPSEWSWSDSPVRLKKLAYCNQLDDLIKQYEMALWIHGHVHHVFDYKIGDTRVLCNPRGYQGHRTVSNFNLNKVVEI